MKKYVYFFGEGNKDMKDILGGKGANLSEMANLGIPVPPGFTISTEVCNYFSKNKKYPAELQKQIDEDIKKLENKMKMKLGDKENPLLVSVRSGAAVSMPGMMDTVLNLGLNDDVIQGLIKKTNNERFAWDAYRRFIQMFGDVVMGVEHAKFEEILDNVKKTKGAKFDTELDAKDLKKIVKKYKAMVKKETGKDFPTEPRKQLEMSINAVFGSWDNPRAVKYRDIHEIKGLLGTAVNVQAMVYGNMGETSGTGVLFTRDPSTGENKFYGEYLMNAQGEDVVAGIRTPLHIDKLKKTMPKAYDELVRIYKKAEKHYKDMQDMEFTIQEGKLYLLQTRTGKRTAAAAVRIAVEMEEEGMIDRKTALLRVEPNQLNQLLHKQLDEAAKEKTDSIAKGLPASPGAAVGQVVFNAETAHEWAQEGKKVILARTETSPEDIEGMNAAQGILTSRGGMTSHAAVVARGMGKCCVAGCGDANINEKNKIMKINDNIIKEGDYITLDGSTGEIFLDKIPVVDPVLSGNFAKLMKWADEVRKLKVRTNADTPNDAAKAREFGAEGIGLCRTEHMFFEGDRIKAMREMIVANNTTEREKALVKLLPIQKGDFIGIFEAMKDLPVTIRLLDPPLHEFLPHEEKEINELAKELKLRTETLKEKIDSLKELNPMLGHRGCRLAVTYPEVAEMQTRAIMEAAAELTKKGMKVKPEIMVPLVGELKELMLIKDIIVETAEAVNKEYNVKVPYSVGTMIEIPRACLVADEIAQEAEFFSFGTNDLTQMAFGFSRDDAGTFLPEYVKKDILEKDPFQSLDKKGVGQLIEMGVQKGRAVRKDLKIGICGEHGGDPASIEFCHKVGLDYVSCSPFRVPIARLAAAQAVLKEK